MTENGEQRTEETGTRPMPASRILADNLSLGDPIVRPRFRSSAILIATIHLLAGGLAAQFPEAPDRALAAGAGREVADSVGTVLAAGYVDSVAGLAYAAALRAAAATGRYDTITSSHALATRLTADLNAVRRDGHLGVHFIGDPPPRSDAPDPAIVAERRRRANGAFVKAEILPGNIGYLRFDGFMRPEHAARPADAAFAMLAGTDALIIDLRENRGGSPAMVAYLVTRLLPPGRTELLNTIHIRGDSMPRQYWTVDGLPGDRYERPVYLLMASHTVSAPEEFAYDLRVLKRATIVGEKSFGGANPGGLAPVGHGFGVFVSSGEAINPVTGTNWEGAGITPDVAVPATEALATAHRLALRQLLPTIKDPDFKAEVEEALAGLERP